MQEILFNNTNRSAVLHERDRKSVKIKKVISRKFPNLAAHLSLNILDEKDIVIYSKRVGAFVKLDGDYEMTVNIEFTIYNHLTISVSSDNNDLSFEIFIIFN